MCVCVCVDYSTAVLVAHSGQRKVVMILSLSWQCVVTNIRKFLHCRIDIFCGFLRDRYTHAKNIRVYYHMQRVHTYNAGKRMQWQMTTELWECQQRLLIIKKTKKMTMKP